jgi:hypothetical protein
LASTVAIGLAAACDAPPTGTFEQWRLIEEWRVGGEVEGPHALDYVRDFARLPDGRLIVLDSREQQLHFLGARGQPLRTVGRRGSGPLEFLSASAALVAPGGEILVPDERRRVTTISPAGELVRTDPAQAGGHYMWSGTVDTSGRLVESVMQVASPVDFRIATRRWSQDFARADTLAMCGAPPAPSQHPAFVVTARGIEAIPLSLPRVEYVRDRVGHEWTAREFGSNELVRRAHGSCEVVAVATLAGRVAIPDDVRTLHLERLGRNQSIVPPSDVPREYPFFDALRVDELHRLWVERFAPDGGHRFEIFSVTGSPIAQLDIPRDIDLGRPMVIANNYVYAFARDAGAVGYLVALRIERLVAP